MLNFVDLYRKADRMVGGWLPGGGTANPLSDAVRPTLDALPTAEIDPSLSNYYRENRETAKEQGEAALREADLIRRDLDQRANNAALEAGPTADGGWRMDVISDVYNSEEGRAQQAEISELNTRAARHGVNRFGELLGDASDREAVKYNRANAGMSAEEIRQLTIRRALGDFSNTGQDDEEVRQEIKEKTKRDRIRISEAERGGSLAETINNSYGLDTREGPNGGDLSCVYGVNKVIEEAGLTVPWKDPISGENSTWIPFVEEWITSNGGSVVSAEEAIPGDIVSNGGHMGILTDKVDKQGNKVVLSNSSSRGSMTYTFPLRDETVYRVPQLQGN